jgi:hypothetical protein
MIPAVLEYGVIRREELIAGGAGLLIECEQVRIVSA